MISTVASFKQFLRNQQSDASEDATLTQNLQFADLVLKQWLKRDLEQAVYVEYRSGVGTPDLWTRQRPVNVWFLQGDTTLNSAVVAGLGSTSGLVPGFPCHGVNVGKDAVIASVDGPTQVTLSVASTATATANPVAFGINLWLDNGTFWGQTTQSFGAYPAVTQLQLGRDFVIDLDSPDQSQSGFGVVRAFSRSGVIKRLGGGFTGTVVSWPWEWRRGSLTAKLSPAWPTGYGNVRMQYVAGYTAATMPPELVYAENVIAAWIRVVTPFGVPLDSGAIEPQAVMQLVNGLPQANPQVGSALALIRRYREVSI